MLDAGVKIIDRMIDLLRERERSKRKLFDDFVQPLFDDMGSIHQDYISSFYALIHEIHSLDSKDKVHAALLRRKAELEHLRVKVHSFLKEAEKAEELPKPVNDFLAACVGYFTSQYGKYECVYLLHYTNLLALLSGEASTMMEEAIEEATKCLNVENDIFYKTYVKPDEELPPPRHSLERLLLALLKYVKRKWSEVTTQYAVCRLELLK